MTPVSTAALNALTVDVDAIFAPYDFIIEHQNDACELNSEQTIELLALVNAIPTLSRVTVSSTGLCVGYVSRTADGRYLFVEIDQAGENRFYVTSFVDRDLEYVAGYMPLDTYQNETAA